MILIAGGDGFIGSNLQKLLLKNRVAFEVADIKSGTDICSVDGSKYDVIVLLAANLNHDTVMYQENLRIYRWAIRQVAHIIYSSSAAVYADSNNIHTEQDETPAPTIYGKSKLLGEKMIKEAVGNYTILRLANVYGDGDGNGAIDIFKRGGNKIYGDGGDIRDYVSVKIVCNAIKDVVLNPSKYNHETFNISSSEPFTTRAAYASFGDWRKEPEYLPARRFDVKCSILNNVKAKGLGLIHED